MNEVKDPLKELQHALKSLSPHDLAAFTEQVECRLTDRLRLRQDQKRPRRDEGAPGPSGRPTDKEPIDA